LRFDEAFSRAESEIELGLRTHQRVFDHYHRVFVGNLPYNLYYRLDGARVVIVAVLYARYSPERIPRTLREHGA
jgi:plasmid stabilization system protein ParE